jgi:hypothetical protein
MAVSFSRSCFDFLHQPITKPRKTKAKTPQATLLKRGYLTAVGGGVKMLLARRFENVARCRVGDAKTATEF